MLKLIKVCKIRQSQVGAPLVSWPFPVHAYSKEDVNESCMVRNSKVRCLYPTGCVEKGDIEKY